MNKSPESTSRFTDSKEAVNNPSENSTTVDIVNNYKERIISLWKKYDHLGELNEPGCEYRKSPLAPASVKKNALLFIGINPSFKKGVAIPDDQKEIGFYQLNTQVEQTLPYFQKFKEIAGYCNSDWDHLDLLFLRERKQEIIERLTYNRPDGLNFISEQLDISFEILEKAQPKLIVASNAYVSEFFGKKKTKHAVFDKIWRGFELEFPKDFDNEIGTYRIPINGKQIPIIFSGMLSGQRALDLGSLERLMWQVKMLLE